MNEQDKQGYPIFDISELDLFHFEEFCEQKYQDPNVQKFSFFKVHLPKDVKGQSSMADFFNDFGQDIYSSVKQIIPLQNPNDKELYGHRSFSMPGVSKKNFGTSLHNSFMTSVYASLLQDQADDCPTCCVESLKRGEDDFLSHFYTTLASQALPIPVSGRHTDSKSINNLIPGWQAAFEKRQAFKDVESLEEKRRVLDIGISSEVIKDGGKAYTCQCDACAYLQLEIPRHDMPLGALYAAGIEENFQKHVRLTTNFAMVYLCYKNMLSMLDAAFPGVSFPMLYVGTAHSFFPLHIEDLSLWSFNFLHKGCPKFWIVVPSFAIGKLVNALCKCGFAGIHKTCINNLRHKFYIPSVSWLKEQDIPHHVVIQEEGEGLVLLPNAAHAGGNLGPNVAEACNFGTQSWVPYGCVAMNCNCMDSSIHADLTPIVAVHRRDLLTAYRHPSTFSSAVKDSYFHKSLLCNALVPIERAKSVATTVAKARISCPICPLTWTSTTRKKSVLMHLQKFHPASFNLPDVQEMLNTTFPKK